jgi:prepilin-type N-terminal cleavage/methylation domain-containing protein
MSGKSLEAFTLIELLVVVALIGILSAVGVVSYSGYVSSTKQKNAELSLNAINLGQQEYKSNNGNYYYYSSCSNTSAKQIADNLLDGQDNLSDQDFQFCISGNSSSNTYEIKAYNPDTRCEIKLNEKLAVTRNSSC